uniref:Myrmicitoxin-Ta2a n=1 Tax=Tetramorium africanum TaxID=628533 RepID=TA2A_TETAF|nr:RecName: Full=Myrmicitoxin-Ta2a; Short=MYRTX-Ta2a; Short=Ta2a; AltName: Full=M_MYRTX_Ta1a; Flags: Precursor [Tetramorium africanum]CAH2618699.1 M_MYRTX_Ta1a [Tetramorium africanum]
MKLSFLSLALAIIFVTVLIYAPQAEAKALADAVADADADADAAADAVADALADADAFKIPWGKIKDFVTGGIKEVAKG